MGESRSAFEIWSPYSLRPQVFSIILVFLMVTAFIVVFYYYIKKLDPKSSPTGLHMMMYTLIMGMKKLVYDMLGPRFVKLTPYIAVLFLYVASSNLLAVFGIDPPTSSTTVTFSMAAVTVIGSIVFGIRYQKLAFFAEFLINFTITNKKSNKKYKIPYFINPFAITDYFSAFISISLRLWANITAGTIMLSLFYALPLVFFQINPLVNASGPPTLLFSILAIPLHGYLDILIGLIQAVVFVSLTSAYWSNAIPSKELNALPKGMDEVQVKLLSVTYI